MSRFYKFFASTVLLAGCSISIAQTTVVELTDNVLVKQVDRLGVHFNNDDYYSGVLAKYRVAENFEGTVNRLHLTGAANQGTSATFKTHISDSRQEFWAGADYLVVAGSDAGVRGKVVGLNGKELTLDRPIRWDAEVNGVLLDKTDFSTGMHPWAKATKIKNPDGTFYKESKIDDRNCSPDLNELVKDSAPGSFGERSMALLGSKGRAFIMFRTQFNDASPIGGKWELAFWAKARSTAAKLEVSPSTKGASKKVELFPEWKRYEIDIDVEPPATGENPLLYFRFQATGGDVVIDDVLVWHPAGGDNPTAFRNSTVEVLKDMHPGVMRYLRNDRDTLRNSLSPALWNVAMDGEARRSSFGAHEFYGLCEYLGAAAWATLPGTLDPEEIDQFMEYVGAPADTGFGKLRAQWGHPEPWTKTLPKIHVQFGNEVSTFMGTGFWGPQYWEGMIQRAKASKYYTTNIVFHVNDQGATADKIAGWTPSVDRITVMSYQMFALQDRQIAAAKDTPGFYEFVAAQSWQNWFVMKNNRTSSGIEASKKYGKELSIYEGGNYHTTFADDKSKAPMAQIKAMITGRAGSIIATHNMLLLLKAYGGRTQNSFNFCQENFKASGAFGNLPEAVPVWGGVTKIDNPELRRIRPRFLAIEVANKAIFGDLVEIISSAEKFKVDNFFGNGYGPSRKPEAMTIEMPRICSYGFRDGHRRGVVLVSQDYRAERTVELKFAGNVVKGSAKVWYVDSAGLESSNELEAAKNDPQVSIKETAFPEFASGQTLTLQPGTILSVSWMEE